MRNAKKKFTKYSRQMIIAFNKPYNFLSQFQPNASKKPTLAEFNFPKSVYSIGRLDSDSEGLLILSDEKPIVDKLLNPKNFHKKTYWSQVEGIPTQKDLNKLKEGIIIDEYKTLPCFSKVLDPQPIIPARNPPIRFRKTVPETWIEVLIVEGKNRQVRKMTAAIGFPTLRLIRVKIGELELGNLEQGKWKVLTEKERGLLMK